MVVDKKSVGDVIIRHTCDGKQTVPDQHVKRMVHVTRHGKYYIMLYTRKWPVTRIDKTTQFICEFAGRTA